jgi:putative ribosome biogenesis GTPase RsgA
MQDDDIETIIDQLNRLTVQQQQLTEQIVQLKNEVRNRTTNLQAPVDTTVHNNKNKKRPVQVGDRVRVKNPRKNQPNTGIVDSFTKSGLFARIKLSDNTIINRAPRNLTQIQT